MPTQKPDDKAQAALDAAAAEATARAEEEARVLAEAETAAQKAVEAAEDAQSGGKVQHCPHCRGALIKHDDANPMKLGAWHCNGCGTCWAPGIKHPRVGTPAPAGWKE